MVTIFCFFSLRARPNLWVHIQETQKPNYTHTDLCMHVNIFKKTRDYTTLHMRGPSFCLKPNGTREQEVDAFDTGLKNTERSCNTLAIADFKLLFWDQSGSFHTRLSRVCRASSFPSHIATGRKLSARLSNVESGRLAAFCNTLFNS